ncbi:4-amino-4-deoxy-L-arabinose transferase-like glycosyltransferase [Georgfuchsia toluolica]|uniref:4-amino-4-deoxy-L-arabinose transferase-like glycosyltransferase n=1 Tax=Georgfuchsia toluolica TaxID=424218 RepID=A0A916J2X2_9PROT|nr:phospholipid carrier-dependent glycosyltransferase [Georgfuchsia toluolica]CAG4882991.1 4-amino-4-deoxy-L-arabinose transferase-like glycosyltransferase [Georgfuchsia toluolica]
MRPLKLLLLMLLAALILGLGIAAPTGLTGKDEYLLGLRIPLDMMQEHRWWVPFIDGAPRLKKPPFIYWTARASFEVFGPSLAAARGVTIAFSLLLLGCVTWLGKRFTGSLQTGLIAAGILIGMGGIESESRRLMLDVPVAALSAAAFCCYLRWLQPSPLSPLPEEKHHFLAWPWLIASALCLSAALLTKGPIAVVVFGAGLLALLFFREPRELMFGRWWWHGLLAVMALALPLYWFLYVRQHYGVELAAATQDELEARQLLSISADPLIGIITLSLPWSFIAVHALWSRRHEADIRLLGLWLLFTLLPFFLIRTFERYLIGSLAPLALLAAIHLDTHAPPWTRRLGSLLPGLLALALVVLLWRFERGGWWWLVIPLAYFFWAWWRPALGAKHLIASAALLWSIGWGLAFPALEVNAVPQQVLDLSHERQVTLFAGPQPALLPILSRRPLHQTNRLTRADLGRDALIMLRAEDTVSMKAQLQELGANARPLFEYRALTSAGSGIRFAREGATRDDWQLAWDARSAAPLMSTIRVYQVEP